jgi:hypothetical protein
VSFTVEHDRNRTWVMFDAVLPEAVCDALKRRGFRHPAGPEHPGNYLRGGHNSESVSFRARAEE